MAIALKIKKLEEQLRYYISEELRLTNEYNSMERYLQNNNVRISQLKKLLETYSQRPELKEGLAILIKDSEEKEKEQQQIFESLEEVKANYLQIYDELHIMDKALYQKAIEQHKEQLAAETEEDWTAAEITSVFADPLFWQDLWLRHAAIVLEERKKRRNNTGINSNPMSGSGGRKSTRHRKSGMSKRLKRENRRKTRRTRKTRN